MKEPLAIRWSRCETTSLTITKDTADRYFVSLTVEEDLISLPAAHQQVGIDLGLLDAVILSTGEKVGNPRFFRKDEKYLAQDQKRLSKTQKDSKNRDKGRRKVAKIHAKIADRRQDFLHKLTTKRIRENQVISLESLQVKNMIKNHHLAKSICRRGLGRTRQAIGIQGGLVRENGRPDRHVLPLQQTLP